MKDQTDHSVEGTETDTRKAVPRPISIREGCKWAQGAKNGVWLGWVGPLQTGWSGRELSDLAYIYQILLCFWRYVNFPHSAVPYSC